MSPLKLEPVTYWTKARRFNHLRIELGTSSSYLRYSNNLFDENILLTNQEKREKLKEEEIKIMREELDNSINDIHMQKQKQKKDVKLETICHL